MNAPEASVKVGRDRAIHPSSTAVLLLLLVVLPRGMGGFLERSLGDQGWTILTLAMDLMGLMFVAWAFGRAAPEAKWSPSGRLGWMVVACFAVGMILPGVVGSTLSIYGLRSMVLPLIIGLAACRVTWTRRQISIIHRAILSLAIANCLTALRQAIWGLSSDELSMLRGAGSTYLVDGEARIPGLFSTGQEFSLFAATVAIWCTVGIIWKGLRRDRLTWLAATLSLLGVLVSLQRGPLVALITSVLLLTGASALTGRHGGRTLRRFIAFAVVAVFGVVIFVAVAPTRGEAALQAISSITDPEGDSYQTRSQQTIPVALSLIRARPEGYGTGASGPSAGAAPETSPLYPHILGGVVADNGYFMFALQIGVLGMALVVGFLFSLVRRGRLRSTQAVSQQVRALGLFIGILMLFGGYWGLTSAMTVFWILIATSQSNEAQDLT